MRRKPLIVPTAVLSSLALAGPVSADDAAPTTAPAAQTAPETPAPVEAPAEVESPETPAPAEAHVEADAQAEVVAPEPAEPEVVPQTEADAVADAEVDAPASPPRTFDGPPIIAAPPDAEPDPWMEKLTARAKDLATRDYQPQPDDLPEFLANLDYVGYREIEFRRDHTLFQGRPFELQFFHRGGYHPRRVAISLITDAERAQTQPAATQPAGAPPTTEQVLAEVDYDPAVWNYRASQPPVPLPVDLGFAGIKVLAALNRPADEPFDELLTFLGASYFRALPKGAAYGLSARGLALNTGAGQEEFPSFTAFWIVEPKPGDTALRIYALLDSPSVAGAYRYDITPGVSTDLEVRSALFFRKNVELVGIAPLTSMFWYDEKNPGARRDHRPEVHDSDALLIHSADGERLFRPLRNPPRPTTTTHHADHLTGFGLIQRDLAYEHYRDDEALYHLRPTAWVTPHGDWGPGNVALYGWPVEDEVDDNVVAFFWPDQPLRAGDHAEFAYT
ncbi:MAG: glucan biosynthesis protein, partial [Planctomycetota bacterium]